MVTGAHACDVVILDVVLHRLDVVLTGSTVSPRARRRGLAAILRLTALDGVKDRITGSHRGADDCLARHFSMDDLRARVRALGRRWLSGGRRAPGVVVAWADRLPRLTNGLLLLTRADEPPPAGRRRDRDAGSTMDSQA